MAANPGDRLRLGEAQATGKSDKIARKQRRLEEAQQELREARDR